MDDILSDTKKLAMRMAIIWFIMFSVSSLCTTITASLYGMRWTEIEAQDKVLIILLITANWLTVMMAFFSKAIARAQHGEFPIDTGDAEVSDKTKVRQVTTSERVVETLPNKPIDPALAVTDPIT